MAAPKRASLPRSSLPFFFPVCSDYNDVIGLSFKPNQSSHRSAACGLLLTCNPLIGVA